MVEVLHLVVLPGAEGVTERVGHGSTTDDELSYGVDYAPVVSSSVSYLSEFLPVLSCVVPGPVPGDIASLAGTLAAFLLAAGPAHVVEHVQLVGAGLVAVEVAYQPAHRGAAGRWTG